MNIFNEKKQNKRFLFEFSDFFLPFVETISPLSKKKSVILIAWFNKPPGLFLKSKIYLLIKMDMDKEVKYLIENLTGVMSFVGPQGTPQSLKHEEVNRILGVVEGSKDKEIVKSLFKVGDHVKVTDGPFMEFSGFVKEVNDEKQKLKVSVSIFGRPTPVELDYLQVEKE